MQADQLSDRGARLTAWSDLARTAKAVLRQYDVNAAACVRDALEQRTDLTTRAEILRWLKKEASR